MINFYRKFLHEVASVLAPLMDALNGPGKSLAWSPVLNSTFTRAEDLLSSVSELVHPRPDASVSLAVDTSNAHLGAVLQQLQDGSWAPLSFYSSKLSDAERKYSAFDRKHLAAYSSLRHSHFLLECRDFNIFTDHKPLTHALLRVSLLWSACQQRHLSYLAEFTSSVVRVLEPESLLADTSSRPYTVSSPAPAPAQTLVSLPSASALVFPISSLPSFSTILPYPSPL